MSSEDIQTLAIRTYNNNLKHFEINQKELFDKLSVLNKALEVGAIKATYELKNENNYFDAKNLKVNKDYYSTNSIELSKKMVEDQVSFLPTKNSFKCFYELNSSKEKAKKALQGDILDNYTVGDAPFVHFSNSRLPFDQSLNKIYKYIIFGVGLGLHIPMIDEKLNSSYYLIVEPNLEIFRLSMFVTDYAKLSEKSVVIYSIAQNEFQFRNSFEVFMAQAFVFNHYIKLFKLSNESDTFINIVQNVLVSQGHLTYSYERTFPTLHRTHKYIEDNYNILNLNKVAILQNLKKPILLLAAGPSLQKQIDFVKENQDKFIIIAIYATLPLLEMNNIKPDIITQYDAQNQSVLNTIEKIKDIKFFDESILLFSSHVNENLLKAFNKKNIFMFQALYELKQNFAMLSNPSIGELTYAFALLFKPDEIFLLGLDLAMSEEGDTHIYGHSGSEVFEELKSKEDSSINKYSYKKNIIEIKGNFKDIVLSTPAFKTNIDIFNKNTVTYKADHTKVYNLSNGAFFNNTIPKKIEDIDTSLVEESDKKELFNQIHKYFITSSEQNYNKEDLDKITLKLSDVKRLKKVLIDFYKVKSYKSKESYTQTLFNFCDKLLQEIPNALDLKNILENYASHTFHYIFYIINLKSAPEFRTYYKEANEIIYKQFNKIIDTYVISMLYTKDQKSPLYKKFKKYDKEYKINKTYNYELLFKELYENTNLLDTELLKKSSRNSIGFFLTNENLNNESFVKYINEVSDRFEEINFKAYYYSKEQEIVGRKVFSTKLNKFEFINPNSIDEIAENIELWINSNQSTSSLKEIDENFLVSFKNIYALEFKRNLFDNAELKERKETSSVDTLHKQIEDEFILPQSDYYLFKNNYKNTHFNKTILKSYKKNSLGFFAIKENLSNKSFISYIKELKERFKEIELKIFYLKCENKDIAEEIFKKQEDSIEYILPKSVEEIAQNIEVWISSDLKDSKIQILNGEYFTNFENIYSFEFVNDIYESYTKNIDIDIEDNIYKNINTNFIIPQTGISSFYNSIQNTKEEETKDLYEKDSIGFLAIKETLKNIGFLTKIKEIHEIYPHLKINIFYFDEEYKYKIENSFPMTQDVIKFIKTRDIFDILRNTELFLYPSDLENFRINFLIKSYISRSTKIYSVKLDENSLIDLKKNYISGILNEYNKEVFIKSFNTIVEEEILSNSFKKDSIGFLATKENLEDKNFVKFIKESYTKFPQVKFKAFYFHNDEKKDINNIFNNEMSRIEGIIPMNILDLTSNVEVWYSNSIIKNSDLHHKIFKNLLYKCKKIYFVNYSYEKFSKTIEDFDNESKNHPYLLDNEYFGFSNKQIENANNKVSQLISSIWNMNTKSEDLVEDFIYSQINLSIEKIDFNEETTKLVNLLQKRNNNG